MYHQRTLFDEPSAKQQDGAIEKVEEALADGSSKSLFDEPSAK